MRYVTCLHNQARRSNTSISLDAMSTTQASSTVENPEPKSASRAATQLRSHGQVKRADKRNDAGAASSHSSRLSKGASKLAGSFGGSAFVALLPLARGSSHPQVRRGLAGERDAKAGVDRPEVSLHRNSCFLVCNSDTSRAG